MWSVKVSQILGVGHTRILTLVHTLIGIWCEVWLLPVTKVTAQESTSINRTNNNHEEGGAFNFVAGGQMYYPERESSLAADRPGSRPALSPST